MMMGSVEQEIKDMSEVPTDLPTVINDFDEVIIRIFFFLISLYSCMYLCVYVLSQIGIRFGYLMTRCFFKIKKQTKDCHETPCSGNPAFKQIYVSKVTDRVGSEK